MSEFTKRCRMRRDRRVEEEECSWSRLQKCCLRRCIECIFHRESEFLWSLLSQIQGFCFP